MAPNMSGCILYRGICMKFGQSLITIFNRCPSNQVSPLCIMPKRSLQSLSLNKKIRLGKHILSTDNKLTHSRNSYSNLQTVSEKQQKNSLKENKMRINNANGEKEACVIKVEYLDSPVKSESDKKDYRVIRLENGITALLISDKESLKNEISLQNTDEQESSMSNTDEESEESEAASHSNDSENEIDEMMECEADKGSTLKQIKNEEKMAACGLCIGVGSFSDPIEIQGMAHFLEHMVFMGSERYPQENDFDTFIKKRGGSDNASTDCEQTTFYFEIQEKHLYPAMDRFAQFFINPLMKRDTITREREAIESEFKMALPSDSYRKEQLFCSLARKNHPATKFSWGNLITLRDNIDDDRLYLELHKFRKRHYSAHRMTLAVQARLSLDKLEQYVKDCFSNVPVNHLPAEDFSEFKGKNSFDSPEFRKIYRIKPVKDVCQVELTWVMPPLHHLYKSKPHQYLSWIIGHEGKGSLIHYLRKKMWCLDIFSGNGEGGFEHCSMYALFSLSLVLTDEGNEHFKEVLETIFSYINMLHREGPQKRIFEEIQEIENINFRFTDEEDPVDYVETLCESMHFYPPTDYITGSDLYFEYNSESIKECIEALNVDNVNIILFDKKFNEKDFHKVEPWFQTKYSSSEIPKEWIDCWKKIEPLPEFHLPKPNAFITRDFNLIDLPNHIPDYPIKIYHNNKVEIWHRVDPKFRLPECYIYLDLQTPLATESPKSSSILNLFVAILKHLMVGDLYDAIAAELIYQIDVSDNGIGIKVYGFNEKLSLLLSLILKYIALCHKLVTEELFDIIRKEILKYYYNVFIKPAKLTKEVRLSILTSGFWTSTEKYAAISHINYNEFVKFAEYLTDHIYIKCLLQGNMTQDHTLKNILECIEPLKCDLLEPSNGPCIKVYEIPYGEKCCQVKNFNPTDFNSVVTNYYQSGLTYIKLSVIIDLLMMIMEEPLFNQLRTREQLGYSIFCLLRDTFGVLGYSITVYTQAHKFTTEYVDERIEHFIKDLIGTLKEMSNEEYNIVQESLIKLKQCTDIHLKQEVDRNWKEITHAEYMFDRVNKEIAVINCITLDEVHQWLSDHAVGGENFRKLTIQIVGTASSDKDKHQDEGHTNSREEKYCLNFLSNKSNEKWAEGYYITDIEGYKKNLSLYPVHQKKVLI